MDPYKGIARFYDPVTAGFLSEPRKAMIQACSEAGARRILDIGCGTGIFLDMLQGTADIRVGLDTSRAMLAKGTPHKQTGIIKNGRIVVCGDASAPPLKKNSFDLLTYSLVLHETSSDADTLIRNGLELAPQALVLEWRMPERNLDCLSTFWVPVVERMAGKEHFHQYRNFMRSGGLHGLAQRTGLTVVYERPLRCQSLVLALLRP